MGHCFTTAAAEAIRLMPVDFDSPEISIELDPIYTGKSRARATERYTLFVSLNWGGSSAFSDGVFLVDSRGYTEKWKYEDVGKWLVKCLPGVSCVVNVKITDCVNTPPKWTPSRVDAALAKVTAIDVAALRAAAESKVLSVQWWSDSQRRTDVLDAAAVMQESCDLVELVRNVQGGGTFDGGSGYDPNNF